MPRILSIAALEAALEKKRKELESLASRRAALLKELEQVDREIAALQGSRPKAAPAPKPRVRRAKGRRAGKRKEPLGTVVMRVLKEAGRPLSVKEIAEGVLAAGYRTKSKDFSNVVAQFIYTSDAIERAERGRFILRGDAAQTPPAEAAEAPQEASARAGRKRNRKPAAE